MKTAVDIAKRSDAQRVVITGMGVISPNGIGVDEFWRNCIRGKSGVVRIDDFDVSRFESQIAGVVRNFDPDSFDISETQKKRRWIAMRSLRSQRPKRLSGIRRSMTAPMIATTWASA